MVGVPFKIDLKAVRRYSKGAIWFKKGAYPDGSEYWDVGCGGPNCVEGRTVEEALAKLIVRLSDMAHADGGWNPYGHKTPDI